VIETLKVHAKSQPIKSKREEREAFSAGYSDNSYSLKRRMSDVNKDGV
jgi:hypothetical protein